MARKSKSGAAAAASTKVSIGLEPAVAVILYHGKSGTIFSTHYFSAAAGAELPERDELERIAMAQAVRDGCKAREHKALHVDPVELERGVPYRVSVKKGVLAAMKPGRVKKVSALRP